ncbi:MAG: HPr kinase/phosphorylase [Rhodocyclaceae bacterium]|jgi:HPr kinase/phosphorylase|nr:HPr kinase/phosphorylase [Rhodocyclaceae bacterium]MCA3073163.1 HPr kinase/phosphorylase [Rhodocyclaceae bacterium]MCA3090581.1 HPr kinase/phosphorylase [Rhodocyclaceae bacterium]MCA3094807.1 HPr kinase/phosphorylase [Rhodocyclaceae bacterium]MCA3097996.1 HPr kinase/phosphorylase [Rhodocyclaceae bacterium]
MPRVSATQLFEDTRGKLQLAWAGGHASPANWLDSERINASAQGLIGHLNVIHPNWIQVLSPTEIRHLDELGPEGAAQVLDKLASSDLACVIVSDGQAVPPPILAMAEARPVPLLSTPLTSIQVMWIMRPYLARALAEYTEMHGVLLDVLDVGVMITGQSGVGKSELALELISRGHGLIADDVVELYRIAPNIIEGRCPAMLKDFLEVRGLGMLSIRTIFGETAIRIKKNLKLIVELQRASAEQMAGLDRLPLRPERASVLGVPVRKVILPVAAGRNLAVLTEAAVRNFVLELRGFDSTQEFMRRQESLMAGPADPDGAA